MVRNVVRPANSSVRTSAPAAFSPKIRSSMPGPPSRPQVARREIKHLPPARHGGERGRMDLALRSLLIGLGAAALLLAAPILPFGAGATAAAAAAVLAALSRR